MICLADQHFVVLHLVVVVATVIVMVLRQPILLDPYPLVYLLDRQCAVLA